MSLLPKGSGHKDGGLTLEEGLQGGVGHGILRPEGRLAVVPTHDVRHHVRRGLAHDEVSGGAALWSGFPSSSPEQKRRSRGLEGLNSQKPEVVMLTGREVVEAEIAPEAFVPVMTTIWAV